MLAHDNDQAAKRPCPYPDCACEVSPEEPRCSCPFRRALLQCPNPECRKANGQGDDVCRYCGHGLGSNNAGADKPAADPVPAEGMLTYKQASRMVADAYSAASLAGADMRGATDALEIIRAAVLTGNDPFEAWETLDAQVGLAEANRLQPTLVRLRTRFEQLTVARKVARLDELFRTNPDAGRLAWQRSLAEGLTAWRMNFCRELCEAPLPFPQDDDLPIEFVRISVRRVLHARWAEAFDLYARLVERDFIPALVRAKLLVNAGEICLYHFFQTARGKVFFDRAAQLAPDECRVHSGLGQYWTKQGDLEQAKACFQRAISAAPNLACGYTGLGECYEKANDLAAAEAQYQQAIKAAPGIPDGYVSLLKFHGQTPIFAARKNNIPMLVNRISAMNPQDEYDTYLEAGSVFQQNQQPADAHEWYQKAIATDTTRLGAYTLEGYLYLNNDDFGPASEQFRRAIDVAPEAMDGYWGMSWLCDQQEKWQEALNWCEESLKRRPEWEGIIKARTGGIRRRLGQFAQAEDDLRQALLIEPDNQQALNALTDLADDYYMKGHQADAALRTLEEARRLRGESFESGYQNRIGNLKYYYGDYAAAAEAYKKAIAAKPTDPVFHSNLALALERLPATGNRVAELGEAIEALRRALDLAPTNTEYAARRDELERLRRFVARYGESALKLKPMLKPIQILLHSNLWPSILVPGLDVLSEETFRLIDAMRDRIFEQSGLTIPGVLFKPLDDAEPGSYRFIVMEEPGSWAGGNIALDEWFAPVTAGTLSKLGIKGRRNPYAQNAMEGCWITANDRAKAQAAGVQAWSAIEYLLRQLEAVLKDYAAHFVDYEMTMNLVKKSKAHARAAIEGAPHKVVALTRVLKGLLSRGISIHPFDIIIDEFIRLHDAASDVPAIIDRLRAMPELDGK
jgi:tetratricopeptide (TPR) repeat protein